MMIYKFGVICVSLLVNNYVGCCCCCYCLLLFVVDFILPPIEGVGALHISILCAMGYPYINEEASLKNKNKKTRRDCPLFLFFT